MDPRPARHEGDAAAGLGGGRRRGGDPHLRRLVGGELGPLRPHSPRTPTRAQFAAFDEPGYVKIVYTLAADPLGPNRSSFVTRTRVVTTDPESRRRFRRYWAPMSTGIILIRYLSLPMVKREAERRARHPAGGQPPTDLAGEESTTGTSPARP
jgi:hypothetical protein